MTIEIKKIFTSFGEKKTPENKGGLPVFLLWKFIAPIPRIGKM